MRQPLLSLLMRMDSTTKPKINTPAAEAAGVLVQNEDYMGLIRSKGRGIKPGVQ